MNAGTDDKRNEMNEMMGQGEGEKTTTSIHVLNTYNVTAFSMFSLHFIFVQPQVRRDIPSFDQHRLAKLYYLPLVLHRPT